MENLIIQTPKGKRIIGQGQPIFIVAEMSANHLQDFNRALKIIDAAAEAGADAIKLQTYTADTITINCDKEQFQVKTGDNWKGQTLYNLYQQAHTPWQWQLKLKEYGEKKGLIVFSTPFDATAVDFLEELDMPLYKVASPEIVDIPLLKKIAQTKKPVIMSRGMASIDEIKLAIKTLRENGCQQIAILHCVSAYPTPITEMNLATIPDIIKKFNVVSGLSSHCPSIIPAIASVVLAGSIIEQHLTLSRKDGGPDSSFSLEPSEFKAMAEAVRQAEKAIGKPNYKITKTEEQLVCFRRSLFAVRDIKRGERFSKENVRSIRPGYGLPPKYYEEIIGKRAAKDIEKGTPLNWNLIKQN